MTYKFATLLGLLSILPMSAQAQNNVTPSELQSVLAEIEHLKSIQAETQSRISNLEALIQNTTRQDTQLDTLPAQKNTSQETLQQDQTPKLLVSGDFFTRFEGNYNSPNKIDRERAVMRARLRGDYQVSDAIKLGAMLETGDPDDPNSGYLTVDEFADDLQISLSQAFIEYSTDLATFRAGKIPMPFKKTDLVWDGDVYPTGLSLQSDLLESEAQKLSFSSLLFLIDENATGEDSSMIGGQLSYEAKLASNYAFGLNAAYYDYEIESMEGANSGDTRDNLLDVDGQYLSDFDILDVLASFKWIGPNENWPINLNANIVQNFGSAVDDDTAYGVDLSVGKTSAPKDMKFGYGYGQAEVDAVFSAFSNDNFRYGTNYEAHKLSFAYQLDKMMQLSASVYHYRRLNELYLKTGEDTDWQDRVRFNFIINF